MQGVARGGPGPRRRAARRRRIDIGREEIRHGLGARRGSAFRRFGHGEVLAREAIEFAVQHRVIDQLVGPGDHGQGVLVVQFPAPAKARAQGRELQTAARAALQTQFGQRAVDLTGAQMGVVATQAGGRNALIALDRGDQRMLDERGRPHDVTAEALTVAIGTAVQLALGGQCPAIPPPLDPGVVAQGRKKLLNRQFQAFRQRRCGQLFGGLGLAGHTRAVAA